MQTRLISRFGLSLFYLACTIGIEIMTFVMLDIGFLPKYVLYDLGLMLMFMGIIFIIPNYLAQYIVTMFILLVQTVLTYVNYTLYHLYGDVFSFDMVKLFKHVLFKARIKRLRFSFISIGSTPRVILLNIPS